MIALVVAAALGALEWRVVRKNVGVEWNGYGAIPGVWKRDSDAPMRYRVLVPWVLAVLARVFRFRVCPVHYQVVKTVLLAGALAVAEVLLGRRGMLGLAVLVAVTFEFDYWDCYAELLGVGLVLWGCEGRVWAVMVGAAVWGLSRETAGIAPALGLVGGGLWCGVAGLAGPVVLGIVRLVQGKAVLYCERWIQITLRISDLALAGAREDVGPWVSVGWTMATVAAVVLGREAMPAALARTAGIAPVWLAAGWLMARARETRVFLPCALWLAAIV